MEGQKQKEEKEEEMIHLSALSTLP